MKSPKVSLIFVCGYLCSGKTTTAGLLGGNDPYFRILDVSDIVKRILGQSKRSDLQGHPELDQQIISEIDQFVLQESLQYDIRCVIVTGARQLSILYAYPNAQLVWVSCHSEERYRRFQKRKTDKDEDRSWNAFVAANKRDVELGLNDVRDFIFKQGWDPTMDLF